MISSLRLSPKMLSELSVILKASSVLASDTLSEDKLIIAIIIMSNIIITYIIKN